MLNEEYINSHTSMNNMNKTEEDIKQLVDGGVNEASAREFIEELNILEKQAGRAGFNLGRVTNLINTAFKLESTEPLSSQDILRSSVVLLHATLEDYLRILSEAYLRFAPESKLNEIPLLGMKRNRPEKILLGKLSKYRDLSVNELIDLSIKEYLETTSYNDTTEITSLLQNFGCEAEKIQIYLPDINEMIKRRHAIVHRADISSESTNNAETDLINKETVLNWKASVYNLIQQAMKSTTKKRLLALFVKRKNEQKEDD